MLSSIIKSDSSNSLLKLVNLLADPDAVKKTLTELRKVQSDIESATKELNESRALIDLKLEFEKKVTKTEKENKVRAREIQDMTDKLEEKSKLFKENCDKQLSKISEYNQFIESETKRFKLLQVEIEKRELELSKREEDVAMESLAAVELRDSYNSKIADLEAKFKTLG